MKQKYRKLEVKTELQKIKKIRNLKIQEPNKMKCRKLEVQKVMKLALQESPENHNFKNKKKLIFYDTFFSYFHTQC